MDWSVIFMAGSTVASLGTLILALHASNTKARATLYEKIERLHLCLERRMGAVDSRLAVLESQELRRTRRADRPEEDRRDK
mgnify:FL=1